VILRRLPVILARYADAVRVVSSTTRDDLRARGVNAVLIPSRLAPHWTAGHLSSRVPLANPADTRIVAVGRLVPSKGFDLLLSAFAELRPNEVKGPRNLSLTFVGDGPLGKDLRVQAEALGVLNRVHFVGFLSSVEVKDLLMESDVLVISSRDEGTPRALFEGVAAGLPVVATRVGGIPEAAADLPSVVLASPEATSLAEALSAVLADPPEPTALVESRRLVFERYEFGVNLVAVAAFLEGRG
jgi:glycosyltransferase involved in cell wall biosynthesis